MFSSGLRLVPSTCTSTCTASAIVYALGEQPLPHTCKMPEVDAVERKRKRKDKDAKVRYSCASSWLTGRSLVQGGAADQDRCRWFARSRDRPSGSPVRAARCHMHAMSMCLFDGCRVLVGVDQTLGGMGSLTGRLRLQKKSKKGKKEKRSRSDAPNKAGKTKRRKKEKRGRQSSSSDSSDSSSDSDGGIKRLTPEIRLTMGRLAVQVLPPRPSPHLVVRAPNGASPTAMCQLNAG